MPDLDEIHPSRPASAAQSLVGNWRGVAMVDGYGRIRGARARSSGDHAGALPGRMSGAWLVLIGERGRTISTSAKSRFSNRGY
jgi:hypothetical protein